MLAAVMSSSKMPSDSREEAGNKEKVMIFIKTHSDPQKGCRYEDIIAYMKDNGMEQADTDELLNQLGADGDIYVKSSIFHKAPSVGAFHLISSDKNISKCHSNCKTKQYLNGIEKT